MKIRSGQETIWQEYRERNQDFYGQGIIDYAERWANLMEAKLEKIAPQLPSPRNAADSEILQKMLGAIADPLSHKADTDGITGFMYGAAVSTLANVWEYGEELRRWHNLETQIGNEGEKANKEPGATLNPALLNIKPRD